MAALSIDFDSAVIRPKMLLQCKMTAQSSRRTVRDFGAHWRAVAARIEGCSHAAERINREWRKGLPVAPNLPLPKERLRTGDLLRVFPAERETTMQKLLDGLGTLWRQHSNEKTVIFATYLGTVDMFAREIEQTFPGQSHGGGARRRSRSQGGSGAALPPEGRPARAACAAAGREGINLQFARILFNFDLPWNPMDREQRIGRIHRYGQSHLVTGEGARRARSTLSREAATNQDDLRRMVLDHPLVLDELSRWRNVPRRLQWNHNVPFRPSHGYRHRSFAWAAAPTLTFKQSFEVYR